MASSLVDGYADSAPMYLGALYGLRVWKIVPAQPHFFGTPSDPDEELVLRSVFRDCIWTPGVMQAKCLNHTYGGKTAAGKHRGRIAGIACECGFFGCWDQEHIPVTYVDRSRLVFGVLRGTGTVTWGTRGFKTAKGEIAAFIEVPIDDSFRGRFTNPTGYHTPRDWLSDQGLQDLAGRFGVPVVQGFETAKELFGIEGKPKRK